ncbi:MAG: hypothetical protein HY888_11490 [Deltaproteobacteria bacterium]|nr:hypothetical protein [Deltaproteobacteria bacterium]
MEYLIINVEEKVVTSARFELSRRSAILLGAASFELEDGVTLADAARQIAGGLNGSPRVVLCLPSHLFAQRLVALPLTDLRKVREVMPSQLQGEIALPVEELVLDALPAGEGHFLALWARKSDISHAVDLFREAGIEPQVVSCQLFAWGCLPGIPEECAVCDGSALALLAGGRLTFFQASDTPLTPPRISATLSALELTGSRLPARLTLVGTGSAALAGSDGLVLPAEQLTVPPDTGHLFKNEATFQQLAGLYAVAKASQAGALPDFRQGELAWTAGDALTRRKLLITGVLAAVFIVLLFVSKLLQYSAVNSDINSLNKSISAIYREVFPTRAKAVDEVSEIRGEIRKLAGADTSSGFLDILKKLAEAKGTTINGLYEAELEGRSLRIKGDARSAQAAGEFKAALAPFMSSAELGEVKSRADGTVSFSLTGTLKEAAR